MGMFMVVAKPKIVITGWSNEMTPIMQYFEASHLPPQLQEVSTPICDLAKQMNAYLPDGPEKSAGLRKLLEAKDCFVRAAL